MYAIVTSSKKSAFRKPVALCMSKLAYQSADLGPFVTTGSCLPVILSVEDIRDVSSDESEDDAGETGLGSLGFPIQLSFMVR